MGKSLYKCWSRLLIDNHISDLRPEYMSRFEPAAYVEAVRMTGVESSMVYACDHNGNCYYPTKVGHFHKGCKGRDIFGETVRGLSEAGILPIAYYTVIYHNESAQSHPEWSIRDINGCTHEGRYRWSCPNHPDYCEFARKQLAEVMAYPELGGIFIDMTFWPRCCCCDSCRRKYREFSGREIPEIIDWANPEWVEFQRWREASMAEFAAMLTAHIRKIRPDVTVTHQFSPVLAGWWLGQNGGIAEASDYASGDFYGGRLQHRFGAKTFDAFTTRRPFEFMTSRCVTLYDHTSAKSDDELFLHAVSTLANGGAYFFIDAINPDGTLNMDFYRRLRGIGVRLENYRRTIAVSEPVLQGTTGLWFSMLSCIDEGMNGTELSTITAAGNNMSLRQSAVLDETLECAAALNRIHASWKVVVGKDDAELDGIDTLILCNVAYLSKRDCERIRKFVEKGGRLLATGKCSLRDENGGCSGNFQLADVLGVDYTGKDAPKISYITNEDGCWAAFKTTPPLVQAGKDTVVRAHAAFPDFPPRDENNYASIHSDPPGKPTEYAAWTEHKYGLGRAVYIYNAVAAEPYYSQHTLMDGILASIVTPFVTDAENLPQSTEVTLLKAASGDKYMLCVVDCQQELPNIPLHNIKFSVNLPDGVVPVSVHRATDGAEHPFNFDKGRMSIEIPSLKDAEFFTISTK